MSADQEIPRRNFILGTGALLLSSLFPAQACADKKTTVKRLHAGSAFIIGQDDFLDDSALGAGQKFNSELDTPFYTSSLIKIVTILTCLDKIRAGALAVQNGEMAPDKAITMDDVIGIEPFFTQKSGISSYASYEEDLSVGEALELGGSFSLNDGLYFLAARVAHGEPVPQGTSKADYKLLVDEFVTDYMRPFAKKIGMNDTFICTPTGLPTYENERLAIPTWKNDVSTQRDMMKAVNYLFSEHFEHVDLFSNPSVKLDNISDPYLNSTPILERSMRSAMMRGDYAAALPVDGCIGGKTGFTRLSNLNAICFMDLEAIGGQGYGGVMSLGNTNETFATHPKMIWERAIPEFEKALGIDQDLYRNPNLA